MDNNLQTEMHAEKIAGKKKKKDKIFIIIMGIVLANLVFTLGSHLVIIERGIGLGLPYWSVLFGDFIAITGCLWLLRAYRKTVSDK